MDLRMDGPRHARLADPNGRPNSTNLRTSYFWELRGSCIYGYATASSLVSMMPPVLYGRKDVIQYSRYHNALYCISPHLDAVIASEFLPF